MIEMVRPLSRTLKKPYSTRCHRYSTGGSLFIFAVVAAGRSGGRAARKMLYDLSIPVFETRDAATLKAAAEAEVGTSSDSTQS
jgi:hypothetical protein